MNQHKPVLDLKDCGKQFLQMADYTEADFQEYERYPSILSNERFSIINTTTCSNLSRLLIISCLLKTDGRTEPNAPSATVEPVSFINSLLENFFIR